LLTPLIELIILWGGRSPSHSQLSTRFFLPPQLCTLLDQTHLPAQVNQLAQSTSPSHPITSLYPNSPTLSHPLQSINFKPPAYQTALFPQSINFKHLQKYRGCPCHTYNKTQPQCMQFYTHTHTCFFLMNHLRNALFPKPLFSL